MSLAIQGVKIALEISGQNTIEWRDVWYTHS